MSAQEEVFPCLVWICRGDEGYGVRSAIINFSLCLERRGWKIVIIGLNEGILLELSRDLNWYVSSLNTGEFANAITGNFFQRINSWVKTLNDERAIVDAALKVDLPANHKVMAVQTFNMLLLKSTSALAKKFNVLGIWRMPGYIKARLPINYPRILLQYTLSTNKILAMGTSVFTARSLGRGPALVTANPHGVDTEKFKPNQHTSLARGEFDIPADAVVFTIVARLYENDFKGQLTLATALSSLAKTGQKLHLLLIGGPSDGTLANSIIDITKGSNLKVQFTGEVNDVEKYFPLVDVAVNAGPATESFGMSVVEAMLMEKPVLVLASGGPAEIVDDNVTGWHALTGSVSDLETAIERCISDRSRWVEMGKNARQKALEHYSVDAECSRWLEELVKHTEKLVK